jgi:hypothetical protein
MSGWWARRLRRQVGRPVIAPSCRYVRNVRALEEELRAALSGRQRSKMHMTLP